MAVLMSPGKHILHQDCLLSCPVLSPLPSMHPALCLPPTPALWCCSCSPTSRWTPSPHSWSHSLQLHCLSVVHHLVLHLVSGSSGAFHGSALPTVGNYHQIIFHLRMHAHNFDIFLVFREGCWIVKKKENWPQMKYARYKHSFPPLKYIPEKVDYIKHNICRQLRHHFRLQFYHWYFCYQMIQQNIAGAAIWNIWMTWLIYQYYLACL